MIKLIVSFHFILLSFFAFFNPQNSEKNNPLDVMPMCNTTLAEDEMNPQITPMAIAQTFEPSSFGMELDSAKTYTLPTLSLRSGNEVMLTWTEKDAQGMVSFCLAFSKDQGKTFMEKKTIYSGTGIGNSRLMRAKVLCKKDGTLVAVFSNRTAAPATTNPPKKGGGRSSDIVYCVSSDAGATWTAPQSVDSDVTTGIVRGFFDATLMANDEVAVAYLKDVANSTKHEERDLRMVVTKNGVFQPEKLIDPVVCDCCNISLLLDAKGALNVYYRDNNEDIRDIARMTSTDNGATFSKPQILHNDQWKIEGCPHNGATSITNGKSALIAWFSGTEQEPGIRLVTNEGKKLVVLSDPSAKNVALSGSAQTSVMLWEQAKTESRLNQIAFRKIKSDSVSETIWVDDSTNAANATGVVLNNQLLVAFEVKLSNGKNSLKMSRETMSN